MKMGEAGQEGVVLDVERIKKLLPHRAPFLFVEKLTDIVANESAVGHKAVSFNEPHFLGHFPDYAVMPGVLIVEAMAQTAAVGAVHTLGAHTAGKIVLLMGLKEVRFHLPVRPGDTLFLHVDKERQFGPTSRLRGRARVDGTLVAEAALTAVIIDSGHKF